VKKVPAKKKKPSNKKLYIIFGILSLPLILSSLELLITFPFKLQAFFLPFLFAVIGMLFPKDPSSEGFVELGYTMFVFYPLYGLVFSGVFGYFGFIKKSLSKKFFLAAVILSILPAYIVFVLSHAN
jgi:hypothetical protein